MQPIIKTIIIISFTVMMRCSNNNPEQPQKVDRTIDSVIEEGGEKVKDANEGIKEGLEESKEEFREKTKKLLGDSISH